MVNNAQRYHEKCREEADAGSNYEQAGDLKGSNRRQHEECELKRNIDCYSTLSQFDQYHSDAKAYIAGRNVLL
jgi:hypothetical protein